MVKPAKTTKVEQLKEVFQDAKCVILNDFTGLNVADISELRRKCRESGVTYRVIKNTLAKRSLEELGIEGLDTYLEGPTAVAYSDSDEAIAAQILKEFADEYELPQFKGGYVAGRVIGKDETIRLASLPARDVIVAQVVGTFQAPLRGLVGVLNASLRDLVGVLDAVREKKAGAA
jgi:large subunit ribosomal protein L10